MEIEERLAPRDGLNTFNVVLARMDLPTHGGAMFTFAVTESMVPIAELQVSVPATGQSLDRMTVEAHDALIDILRQLMFRAEKARVNHDRNARPVLQLTTPAAPPEGEFMVDRRSNPDRRAGLDPAFCDFDAVAD
jgi:hypothetical protein